MMFKEIEVEWLKSKRTCPKTIKGRHELDDVSFKNELLKRDSIASIRISEMDRLQRKFNVCQMNFM